MTVKRTPAKTGAHVWTVWTTSAVSVCLDGRAPPALKVTTSLSYLVIFSIVGTIIIIPLDLE